MAASAAGLPAFGGEGERWVSEIRTGTPRCLPTFLQAGPRRFTKRSSITVKLRAESSGGRSGQRGPHRCRHPTLDHQRHSLAGSWRIALERRHPLLHPERHSGLASAAATAGGGCRPVSKRPDNATSMASPMN
jgi:hypothetical protein